MSASRVAERAAAYALQTTMEPALATSFDLLATAPQGVAKLRELILSLAVRGKLVEQKASEKPASHLLERVRVERDALEGNGRKKRGNAAIPEHDDAWAELPSQWVWSSLAEIGVVNPRNDVPDGLQTSFVQMSSIPVALLEPHKTEPRPWREIRSGFTHFAEGDVGVAKITPCFENGKSTIFRNLDGGAGAGTTELHVVRPLASIDPGYILIFLKSPEFLRPGEACMTGSAGQKRLPRRYFETRALPLPPLAEQARIVARVEELMRLCDALEAHGRLQDEQHARLVTTLFDTLAASESASALAENWQRIAAHFDLLLDRPEAVDALEQTILQLAVRGLLVEQDSIDEPTGALLSHIASEGEQLSTTERVARERAFQARIDEELPFEVPKTWRWVRLGDVADTHTGYAFKSSEYANEGVAVLRVTNINKDGSVSMTDSKFISQDNAENLYARFFLKAGDILLVMVGGSLGKIGIVPPDCLPAVLNQNMWKVVPTAALDRSYLVHCLQFINETQLKITHSTHGHLAQGDYLNKVIPLPPLAEQHRIVARVEQLRGLCAELRERLQQSRATQSRLAEALVVQFAGS